MSRLMWIGCIMVIVFSGCMVFKPDERSMAPDGTPERYSLFSETPSGDGRLWWQEFNNPELEGLIETGFGDNFSLREGYARLKQARAFYTVSASKLGPDISANGGAEHSKKGSEDPFIGDSTSNSFSLSLAASYELDLWGKVRSQKKADFLYMNESQANYQIAAMTVAAGIAEIWIDIIATRNEIAFVKESIKTNASLLSSIQLRFEKSQATALDVLQQRQVLASSRSSLPPLEAKERILLNNLSLLTGKPPVSDVRVNTEKLPVLPAVLHTGLPIDLISMRPDIRAAGLRLKAADWEISAARAARLPALSLSASTSYYASATEDVFRNWISNLAASLTGPIFDAGRRKALVKRARAVADERLATYEKTVFSAMMDVENALINEDRQQAYIKALEHQRQAANHSFEEATRRYRAGQVSFITMQERLLRVQAMDGQLIRQKAVLLKYRIALYRALGGKWTLSEFDSGKTNEVKKLLPVIHTEPVNDKSDGFKH